MTRMSYCFHCRFAYVYGQSEKAFTIDSSNNWKMAIYVSSINIKRRHHVNMLVIYGLIHMKIIKTIIMFSNNSRNNKKIEI